MSQRFIRTKEDFTCERCGIFVKGDGYTNHCPVCLYSKHVDVSPGDRFEQCAGLMEPIFVENKSGKFVISHQCMRCNTVRKVKALTTDSSETLLLVAKKAAEN